ncbi:nucleosome assembly protein 1-like 1-B [Tigriopus californicus]|nr:nucleosome assembly protein 1-like 1-B [Tigriopus californicus]|eukprot:TCALIF_01913-PA protein Name:"Similar to nap1l1 Nucleosome assembly protein 1-like 1 (Xenopus tropicalis)" AED:0.05 eAED:0.05 QI:175/1/1/1/0.66/0.75/4/239/389
MSSNSDPEKAMEVVDDDHEDIEDEDDDDEQSQDKVTAQLLKNPAVMAALQGKLNSMVGTPSGYIESLPAPVKRRLKALKKIQFETTKIEAKFYEEIHQLECKYHNLYSPFYEKRSQITKGSHEPTDEECEWPSDDEDDEELSEEMKAKAKLENEKANGEKEEKDVKGVPEFWLTIFKNVDMLQEMVQDHDEPALKSLKDITVTFAEKPMGFTLHFHFATNDFFSDSVLTKEYFMKCEPSEDDPFSFEGPEIVKCKGCPINWKQGKNLTVKTVKTKQKHKSKGSVRTITKTVKNDSFFNFFDPPACEENEEDMDPMTQDLLTADFEIGHYVRERIIPRAVLFFTGEALEDDFDEDEEDSGDEEGEEEEDDPDFVPGKGGKGKDAQECKQQ